MLLNQILQVGRNLKKKKLKSKTCEEKEANVSRYTDKKKRKQRDTKTTDPERHHFWFRSVYEDRPGNRPDSSFLSTISYDLSALRNGYIKH